VATFDTITYGGGRVEFDEIRLGTEFGDVAPIVPEPSTLVLAAMGLLGFGLFVRRKRRA